MSMIKVENLTFSYPSSYDPIFENVSFQIDTDWKLGFVGRNGRGKTRFLNLLMDQYEYRGKIIKSVRFDYFPYLVKDTKKWTMEVLNEVCPQAEEWVAALKNGTVIDHIPSEKLFTVVQLLGVEQMTSNITIGFNLDSKKLGKKGIIKIADKFFCDEEINRISVVAPNVKLNIIRDYEVVEKKEVRMPDELRGIVKCANPKCITNNEPMATLFHVTDKDNCIVKCHYCEKEQKREEITIL